MITLDRAILLNRTAHLGVDYHVISSVGAADDGSLHPVRADGELTGLALPPAVGVGVGVGGGHGAGGGEGGELQSEVADITTALTHRGLARGTVVACSQTWYLLSLSFTHLIPWSRCCWCWGSPHSPGRSCSTPRTRWHSSQSWTRPGPSTPRPSSRCRPCWSWWCTRRSGTGWCWIHSAASRQTSPLLAGFWSKYFNK